MCVTQSKHTNQCIQARPTPEWTTLRSGQPVPVVTFVDSSILIAGYKNLYQTLTASSIGCSGPNCYPTFRRASPAATFLRDIIQQDVLWHIPPDTRNRGNYATADECSNYTREHTQNHDRWTRDLNILGATALADSRDRLRRKRGQQARKHPNRAFNIMICCFAPGFSIWTTSYRSNGCRAPLRELCSFLRPLNRRCITGGSYLNAITN